MGAEVKRRVDEATFEARSEAEANVRVELGLEPGTDLSDRTGVWLTMLESLRHSLTEEQLNQVLFLLGEQDSDAEGATSSEGAPPNPTPGKRRGKTKQPPSAETKED
jgi:hypothetical protein